MSQGAHTVTLWNFCYEIILYALCIPYCRNLLSKYLNKTFLPRTPALLGCTFFPLYSIQALILNNEIYSITYYYKVLNLVCHRKKSNGQWLSLWQLKWTIISYFKTHGTSKMTIRWWRIEWCKRESKWKQFIDPS